MFAGLLLKISLFTLGAGCLFVGGLFAAIGPGATAELLARFLAPVLLAFGPTSIVDLAGFGDLKAVNPDSEIRTLAVMLMAYGVVCLHTGLWLKSFASRVPWLALVFFGAGVARLIGVATMGWPHSLFLILMGLELSMPLLLFILYRAYLHKRRDTKQRSKRKGLFGRKPKSADQPAFLNEDA